MGLTHSPTHLAIDLGAESGRAVLGSISDGRLHTEEIHRFRHAPVQLSDRLAWDVAGIERQIDHALQLAPPLRSVSIDAWGVDFGLLRGDGSLVTPPRAYRDPLTAGVLPRLFDRVPRERIYALTGIQMMEINTLSQLFALAEREAPELAEAELLLLIPDLLRARLCGDSRIEMTNASTTQLLSIRGDWATELVEACGLRAEILPRLVRSETNVGELSGYPGTSLVAGTSHDTAAAVVGTPLTDTNAVYISSGTWSLVGMERDTYVTSPRALALNLSNELGFGRRVRLLRNVMGLWLWQQARAERARGNGATVAYEAFVETARGGPGLRSLIDPDDAELLRTEEISEVVHRLCVRNGEPAPADFAALLRCIVDSLALRYRWTIEALELVSGARASAIHVVGGGSRNALLCQLTADACGLPVLAGPGEATAVGNLIVQALVAGQLSTLEEGRALIAASMEVRHYQPSGNGRWDDAYARFCALSSVGGPPSLVGAST